MFVFGWNNLNKKCINILNMVIKGYMFYELHYIRFIFEFFPKQCGHIGRFLR